MRDTGLPDEPRFADDDSSHARRQSASSGQQQQDQQQRSDGSVASKLLFMLGGAALMWLGSVLYESVSEEEAPQRQRYRPMHYDHRPPPPPSSAREGDDPESQVSQDEHESAQVAQAIPSFLCPITREIMSDPVSTPYGHCYERSAIERWVEMNKTDPLTNLPLDESELTPALNLRNAIQEYLAAARLEEQKLRQQQTAKQADGEGGKKGGSEGAGELG